MATPLPPLPPLPPLGKLPPLTPTGKPTPEHHGFLGTILAIPGDLVRDAKDAATGLIPGMIETGKAVGGDIGDLLHGDASFSRSERIAVAVLKGIAEDFQHPLRRPLNTIFDLWGIASLGAGAGARGASALSAISKGAEAGTVAKALAFGPKPETRFTRLPDQKPLEYGTFSKNPLTRQMQKGVDSLREANPDARIGFRTQTQRYGIANRRLNYEFNQKIERGIADELRILSKGTSPVEQMALRMYAENVPGADRIAYHMGQLPDLKPLGKRNTERTIELTKAAEQYVVTKDGQVEWAPGTEKLQAVYAKMESAVREREKALKEADLMTEQGIKTRESKPARIMAGAKQFPRAAADRTHRFLDGRLKTNDTETQTLLTKLGKAATARRAPSSAKQDLAAGTARVNRIRERIDRDEAHMQLPVEQRSITVMNRYFNNTRKLFEAQKRVRSATAVIAAAAEKDPAARAAIIDAARVEINRLRDGQQGAILLHKKMLNDFAGKIVGGEGANVGRLMVPYRSDSAAAAIYKIAGLGSRGVVGVPKNQSWLKPFTGSLLAKGGGRYDTLALQAERNHEAVRFIALMKFRHDLIAMASDTPTRNGVAMRDPVALRLDELKNTALPADIRQILSKVDGDIKLKKNERELLGTAYETVRDLFFDAEKSMVIDREVIGPVQGIRWIERELLGGLDKQSPIQSLDHGAGRIVLRTLDEINAVAKFITLYLRPATLFPNLLSGVALNLIQQGFLAPANLARTFTLHRTLTPAARAILDQVMGEGKMSALRMDKGIGSGLVNAGARAFGVIQDLPFRRSAFLHEARREGYKKAKDIERLLTDPELRNTLFRVQDRANASIIDYSKLGRFERDLLRRAFYFYPWLKGATVYSGRFLAENPVQAMLAGQVGQMGSEVSKQQFGDLPSWAEGLYQMGERNGLPLSVMTGNILPFSTAADMVGTGLSFFDGTTSPAQKLAANLSPTASAFLAALTGKSGLGATLPQRGFAEQFGTQLWNNTTLAALVKRLTQDQSSRTYPVSDLDAVMGYLLGNAVYARPTNVSVLNSLAAKEQSGA